MHNYSRVCAFLAVAAFCLAGDATAAAGEPTIRLVQQHTLKHNNSAYWAACSRDGKKLATASLDNTVKLWDVADGKHTATLKGHGDGVAFVGFLADDTIATASLDGSLKTWAADGG